MTVQSAVPVWRLLGAECWVMNVQNSLRADGWMQIWSQGLYGNQLQAHQTHTLKALPCELQRDSDLKLCARPRLLPCLVLSGTLTCRDNQQLLPSGNGLEQIFWPSGLALWICFQLNPPEPYHFGNLNNLSLPPQSFVCSTPVCLTTYILNRKYAFVIMPSVMKVAIHYDKISLHGEQFDGCSRSLLTGVGFAL